MCGPTVSTSTSASTKRNSACWSWSGCGSTAPRSSSPWPRATGSRPGRGRTCCATAYGAGCVPRSSPSATGRWGSGPRCAKSSRPPGPSVAGFHKIGNVLSALPKSAHPGAKRALAEIWNAEDRDHARRAVVAFKLAYGAKFSKAVAKVTDDMDVLLAFYDFPAEHWIHLRTTNPIESTFATVRLRQRVIKGPGSRAAGVAMAFKLIESAQTRWRAVNAPHLVALVRAGAVFKNGKLIERPDESEGGDQQVA